MLTDPDRAALDFEGRWYRFAGRKDSDILSELGETPTVHYARVNRLLDDPDALAYSPVLVRRLRRLRDARRAVRTG